MSAPAGPPPPGPPPTVPEGWQVSWSDQYHQWFYVQQATGASQWQHPSGPVQPAASPQQSVYYPPPPQPQYDQQQYGQPQNIPNQYNQQSFAPPPTTAQPVNPGSGGIMGKLTSLDPKAQMALAAGGGLAAGALLEHEIEGFHRPHYGHHGGHHMLGTMAGLMGAAGAGALGAKFFGGKNQAAQAPPQPIAASAPYPVQAIGGQAYPTQATIVPPPPYPGQQPPQTSAPGSALGLGKFAAGGAAIGAAGALAASGVSGFIHNHQGQSGAPPPTSATGGGGIGSFLGGLTHSGGPRLFIHAAAYADKDVTDTVRSLVTPDQVLTIEKMSDNFGDPWPEAEKKMFSVLYQYGDRPMEVWAGSTSNERVDIRNEALANARMAYINKEPGRIVSLIWGDHSVLSKERVEKLEKDGELDCAGLGDGGFYPWQIKSLICYYKDERGGIAVGHARQDGTLRLPWNPLAKWS